MELVPDGCLLERRDDLAAMKPFQLLQIALQTANAVNYLHKREPALAHLDIKP